MSHEKDSMWKVCQKWGSLWDMAVCCPVADPISLRIAGSQVRPLCRLLPSSWEGLLTAPQELLGDEDKACFYFCPCPKSCDFEVLVCNGEEKGEINVSQPQLPSGSPVKGAFLSCTHWDVYRSLTWKKQKTATLSAGLWFTITWASLVLEGVCHSDNAAHVAL